MSLWQPWALLWLSPAKLDETRHWPTRVRGRIAVHAAKTQQGMREADYLTPILEKYFGPAWCDQIAYGAIIGTLDLIGCHRVGASPHGSNAENELCGNHAPGRYLFRRGDFTRFEIPIPYRGLQGFFQVPDEMITGQPPAPAIDLFSP